MTAPARLPSSPCDVRGCTCRAQRRWEEPDGGRRCIGHSKAPEAIQARAKAGADGRKASGAPDLTVPEDIGESRRELIGAPASVSLPPGQSWSDLIYTDAGREIVRAWLLQCVVLRHLDAPRANAALSMIERIEKAQKESRPESKWAGHPLTKLFGIETTKPS